MKKTIFLSVLICCVFLIPQTAFCQSPSPRIYFPESFKNFGETLQGTELTHSFVFENRGKSILIIEDIKSG